MKKAKKKQPVKKMSKKQKPAQHTSVRHVLHNLYFSKPYKPAKGKHAAPKPAPKKVEKKVEKPKEKKPGFFARFAKKPEARKIAAPEPKPVPLPKLVPVEKPNFVAIADKNLEKRFEQVQQYFEKRVASTEMSLMLVKELFEELKRENEALRKERAIMIEKLNTQSFDPNQPTWQEPEEVEGGPEKHPIGSFAGSQSQGNNVKTSLDQLLDLIMSKGSVKVSDASKTLKIKEKQVEEWGKMLEDHGLIEISYPAVGKPVLKKKS